MVCLDAVSGDLRYVADHCTPGVITIRNLESGETATILPPPDLTGFQVLGSARFSPDGSQVAFALAKRDPENEQGWVAVASSSGGTARIVLAGDPGSFYSVPGWMDERTLLVQVTLNACGPTCPGELYLLGADGSSPTRVAEGGFLTLVDDR
jgi:tricorn protease-like protein